MMFISCDDQKDKSPITANIITKQVVINGKTVNKQCLEIRLNGAKPSDPSFVFPPLDEMNFQEVMNVHMGVYEYKHNNATHEISCLLNASVLVLSTLKPDNVIFIKWEDFFAKNEISVNGKAVKVNKTESEFHALCKRLVELQRKKQ